MKLGSLKEGGRDGTLIVVARDLTRAVRATGIAPTLQRALDDWSSIAPRLAALSQSLNADQADGAFDLDLGQLAAPLPRAYEFVDGSAYLAHVERVRKARGAEVPATFYTDPLMYQATSAGFLGPREPIRVVSEDYGIDLEAEVVIVTDDVPMAVDAAQAAAHIQLVGLVNDVSLRNLIPGELAKGFGFLQAKPRSALSPVLVTPDELGEAWQQAAPGHAHPTQRRLVRRTGGRAGHAVRFRPADRACRAHSAAGGRHAGRLGHHRQPRHRQGGLVPGRAARGGNPARWPGDHAVPGLR
jgi:fumarylacetoacetate (FAA) hydrolase